MFSDSSTNIKTPASKSACFRESLNRRTIWFYAQLHASLCECGCMYIYPWEEKLVRADVHFFVRVCVRVFPCVCLAGQRPAICGKWMSGSQVAPVECRTHHIPGMLRRANVCLGSTDVCTHTRKATHCELVSLVIWRLNARLVSISSQTLKGNQIILIKNFLLHWPLDTINVNLNIWLNRSPRLLWRLQSREVVIIFSVNKLL